MNIAVIAPTYLPARRANTIQVMKMTQALAETGHRTHLVVPEAVREPKPDWEELAHWYGLKQAFPVTWLPAHPRLRRYDFGWRSVQWARRWGADVIYTRLPQSAAAASGLGTKTIFEIHDLPKGTMGLFLLRLFLRGRGAYRLVLISQVLRDDLIERLANPALDRSAIVAPDGVDLERYENLPEPEESRRKLHQAGKLDLEPERFTAGYSGHLYSGRGKELILALAARLPGINFLIVGGESAEAGRLQADGQQLGLANLYVTGFVPNAELPLYQAACEALLMPYQRTVAASSGGDISRYLSPMKMFEYLACGRAILASDLPVLKEVLSPKTAVLLPPDDLDAWISALEKLRQEPDRRARFANQARSAAQDYSWSRRVARILGD
jgi:glycosyltransferase involved in cell wall biosynthesis